MKLERALLCVEMDCQEVFETAGSGNCPSCGSGVALPMSQVFNRDTDNGLAAEEHAETVFEHAPLRLVIPDRNLDSLDAVLPEMATPSPAQSTQAGRAEGAELMDFRRYLEARMIEITETHDEDMDDDRELRALTG